MGHIIRTFLFWMLDESCLGKRGREREEEMGMKERLMEVVTLALRRLEKDRHYHRKHGQF